MSIEIETINNTYKEKYKAMLDLVNNDNNEWNRICKQIADINKKKIIEALTIHFTIHVEDAVTIESWIKDENRNNGNHMIEKTKEEIFLQANANGCCKISINNKIIWFVTIMPITMHWISIYERWSLFIDIEYRCLGLGEKLVENILMHSKELPMYCVTNVKNVIKINEKLHQIKYHKTDTDKKIIEMIESAWALLPEDIVYWNKKFNELVKSLE